jgi:hypothetical protein
VYDHLLGLYVLPKGGKPDARHAGHFGL